MAPASALTKMVGSFLLMSEASGKSFMDMEDGVAGGVVSTSIARAALDWLLFPATSRAMAVMEKLPSLRGAEGVKEASPNLVATDSPIFVFVLMNHSMRACGSVFTVKVGRLFCVCVGLIPPTILSSEGMAGASESTLKDRERDVVLTLRASSIVFMVKVCSPSARGSANWKEAVPSAFIVRLCISLSFLSKTMTFACGLALTRNVGRLLLIRFEESSSVKAMLVGASGGMVSMVRLRGSLMLLRLFAMSRD